MGFKVSVFEFGFGHWGLARQRAAPGIENKQDSRNCAIIIIRRSPKIVQTGLAR